MKSYVLRLKLFLRLFAFNYIQKKSEVDLCRLFNFLNGKLFGSPVVLHWDSKRENYQVVEQLDSGRVVHIYNARKKRLILYYSGVKHRVNALATKYLIPVIGVAENDVIIDCGANVGEIGKYFEIEKIQVDYHSFDPSLSEYESCKLNNPNGAINHKGLWKETGELELFEKNDTADSSFIEMSGYKEKIVIDTLTLDDYVRDNGIDRIKLLKLEAEGAEPEILEGAKNTLHKIDWITADCGPERGIKKEMTFKFVINFLMANGFQVEALNSKKSIVLLKNISND